MGLKCRAAPLVRLGFWVLELGWGACHVLACAQFDAPGHCSLWPTPKISAVSERWCSGSLVLRPLHGEIWRRRGSCHQAVHPGFGPFSNTCASHGRPGG